MKKIIDDSNGASYASFDFFEEHYNELDDIVDIKIALESWNLIMMGEDIPNNGYNLVITDINGSKMFLQGAMCGYHGSGPTNAKDILLRIIPGLISRDELDFINYSNIIHLKKVENSGIYVNTREMISVGKKFVLIASDIYYFEYRDYMKSFNSINNLPEMISNVKEKSLYFNINGINANSLFEVDNEIDVKKDFESYDYGSVHINFLKLLMNMRKINSITISVDSNNPIKTKVIKDEYRKYNLFIEGTYFNIYVFIENKSDLLLYFNLILRLYGENRSELNNDIELNLFKKITKFFKFKRNKCILHYDFKNDSYEERC